jgi:hypothetical protein
VNVDGVGIACAMVEYAELPYRTNRLWAGKAGHNPVSPVIVVASDPSRPSSTSPHSTEPVQEMHGREPRSPTSHVLIAWVDDGVRHPGIRFHPQC